jgi:hypothetical protein
VSIYRLGRKPPVDKPRLKLASFLKAGAVPDHPSTVDYGAAINDWKMLGNGPDPENAANGVPEYGVGDCVAVTWANDRYLTTKYLGQPYYPTLRQVVDFYKTQNPGFPNEDEGMAVQLALETLQKQGGPDGVKAVAFAEVDHTNLDEMRAAVAIFGGLWYGVDVTQANEDEFPSQPWDYARNSPVLGGHAVVGPGYGPRLRFVTWAEETEFTDAFVQHQLEEAWAVIWPEHLGSRQFQQGVNLEQLAADYKSLTGRDLPIPEPTPTPQPTPDPGAAPFLDCPPELAARIVRSAARAHLTVPEWLRHHFEVYFRRSLGDPDSYERN